MKNAVFEQNIVNQVFAVFLLFAGTCFSFYFLYLLTSRKQGLFQRLFPVERRRPVPWNIIDAVMIFVFSFLIGAFCFNGILPKDFNSVQPAHSSQTAASENSEELKNAHPLAVLIVKGKENPAILLLCFLTACVGAPLCEEFLFRVVLQGSLEAVEMDWRRRVLPLKSITPGLFPVLWTAFFFAMVHWREPETSSSLLFDSTYLTYFFSAQLMSSLLTIVFGIFYLKVFRKAAWRDLGFHQNKVVFTEIKGVCFAYFPVCLLMITLLVPLQILLPHAVVDQVPLMLFAMTLGIIFFRTHRILPILLFHSLHNTITFVILSVF
ncbi:MAG: CPBP family intramembrane metalloprotease [Planctomycetaceae bacterium]|jgi:membrane protease YdiL (CAAX protease family)|nr:CPBP family intramembrane metalloprotease [Planctomycetaceae bacterium]